MKFPFIERPKENQSTSLTILILSMILVVIAFALNISGVVENTSIALEFFGISSALYFGRNMSINGKSYTAVTNTEPEATKEENK